MTTRPLSSRQYVEEAWTLFSVETQGEAILCNFNADPGLGSDATLCVIPTQARPVVEDPVRMKKKPNVMSEWLDRLTAAGAGILLVHGRWYDDLRELANQVRQGVDGFARMESRLVAVVRESLERGYVKPGRVVVMGSSRQGSPSCTPWPTTRRYRPPWPTSQLCGGRGWMSSTEWKRTRSC